MVYFDYQYIKYCVAAMGNWFSSNTEYIVNQPDSVDFKNKETFLEKIEDELFLVLVIIIIIGIYYLWKKFLINKIKCKDTTKNELDV